MPKKTKEIEDSNHPDRVDNPVENSTSELSTFENVYARLKLAVEAESDSALAAALGITQGSIGVAKKRRQIPPNWIEKISKKNEISADWLYFGEGHMRRGKAQAARETRPAAKGWPQEGGIALCTDCNVVMVPKVRARLSAGGGSLETNADPVGVYSFREDWIRRQGNPKEMVLMGVMGDSMEPDIKEGDMVLIDKSQKDILAGYIYAVGIDDGILVKSVDMAPGKLILRSKNPRYDPLEIDMRGDLGDSVRIIGRVVWWCHEVR